MGQYGRVGSEVPTIDTNIYASGDLIGTKMTFADMSNYSRTGTIVSVTLIDLAKQDAALDVILFDSDPSATTFTNNAALDVADADLAKAIGHVAIAATDYKDFADSSLACVKNVQLKFQLSGSNDLYACLVSRGTPTYSAASDLTLKIGVQEDRSRD